MSDSEACRGAWGGLTEHEGLVEESTIVSMSNLSGRLILKFFLESLALRSWPTFAWMLMVRARFDGRGVDSRVDSEIWLDIRPSSHSSFGGHDSREDCEDMSQCRVWILFFTVLGQFAIVNCRQPRGCRRLRVTTDKLMLGDSAGRWKKWCDAHLPPENIKTD